MDKAHRVDPTQRFHQHFKPARAAQRVPGSSSFHQLLHATLSASFPR
jgi:hypothetical protein